MKKVILLFVLFTLSSCGKELRDPYNPKSITHTPEKQNGLGKIEPAVWSALDSINARFEKTLNFQNYSPGFCINLGYSYALAQNSLKRWEPFDGTPDALRRIHNGRDRFATSFDEAFLFIDCVADPEDAEKFEGERTLISFTAMIPNLFVVLTSQEGIGLYLNKEKGEELSPESVVKKIRQVLRSEHNPIFEQRAQNACVWMGVLADLLRRQGQNDSKLWSACDKNVSFDNGYGIERALNALKL